MALRELGQDEKDTVENALRVAAEKFEDNAKLFREVESEGGNAMLSKDAARLLAERFEQQIGDTRDVLSMVMDADLITLGVC